MTEVRLRDGDVVDFIVALYDGACSACGGRLPWEAAFDVEGVVYRAECCCQHYVMYPHKVMVEVNDV